MLKFIPQNLCLKMRFAAALPALFMCALPLSFDIGTAHAAQDSEQSSLNVRPPEGTAELGSALQRLSRDSRNLDALIDAGNAALKLGDPTAAIGFFARADEIDPRNSRVKAGLGSAVLGRENPFEALRLFDEAMALGARENSIAADRGLAYDLVGKQDLAQQDYKLALRRDNSDETIRRYALSLGISGKREEAEIALTPLLNKRDVDAWRMRAFVLAMNDDIDGAITISDATMQPGGARAIRPFLRYFPRLTPSQQAAAAHFGHFPKEANIGRDNPRNAEFASRTAGNSGGRRTTRADAGLIPVGNPLGTRANGNAVKPTKKANKAPRRRPGRQTALPQPATARDASRAAAARSAESGESKVERVTVAEVVAAPAVTAAAPPPPPETSNAANNAAKNGAVAGAAPPQAIAAASAPRTALLEASKAAAPSQDIAPKDMAQAATPTAKTQSTPIPGFESLGDPATNSFDLAQAEPLDAAANSAVQAAPAAKPAEAQSDKPRSDKPVISSPKPAASQTTAPEPVKSAGFAALMGDIEVPEEELAPDDDAVDITLITPAKAEPKPMPRPAPQPAEPEHPSRHWVQVAGGANVAGLGREWRRLTQNAPKAFADKKGWTTPLNRTNRVLAGPFDSKSAAQAFVNDLAKSDISAFTFTSEAGQVISPLN